MLVKELIELLKDMPQDLEVFSMCEYGQTPERSLKPCIWWIDPEDQDTYASDEEEAADNGLTCKIVML